VRNSSNKPGRKSAAIRGRYRRTQAWPNVGTPRCLVVDNGVERSRPPEHHTKSYGIYMQQHWPCRPDRKRLYEKFRQDFEARLQSLTTSSEENDM
jgi:hypothetical protein